MKDGWSISVNSNFTCTPQLNLVSDWTSGRVNHPTPSRSLTAAIATKQLVPAYVCMYVYILMLTSVCTCVCVYLCLCVVTYVCVYFGLCTYSTSMCTCVCVYLRLCVLVSVCTCVCVYLCLCVLMSVCTYVCVHLQGDTKSVLVIRGTYYPGVCTKSGTYYRVGLRT